MIPENIDQRKDQRLANVNIYAYRSMRYDSLVQLITYANVHAGSTVMTTDSYGGLVSKAILERLGHRNFGGKLVSFFHGTSPPCVDIRPKGEYSPVRVLPPQHLSYFFI